MTQQEKAIAFYNLHHNGKLLVLPNIWDSLGASLLESLGYPAVATASAAIAFSNGYDDGEKIPFEDVLVNLKKITASVEIPVTADIENGYADTGIQLCKNVKLLIETGIVGINIEDTRSRTNRMYPVEIQCDRIRAIRKVAAELNISVFINARTDIFLHGNLYASPEQIVEELVTRGLAYKKAGADCFFPVAMKQEKDIQELVNKLQMPVNILTLPGIPGLQTLHRIGVARVSLGPSFLKIAIKAMKDIALQIKDNGNISAITENEITTRYLKNLITK